MSLDLALRIAKHRIQMNRQLGYRYEPIYVVHTPNGYEAFSREAAAAFPASDVVATVDAEEVANVR